MEPQVVTQRNTPSISTEYIDERFAPVLAASKILLQSLKSSDFLDTYAKNQSAQSGKYAVYK
jgi:hypothetical protein